MNRNDKLIVALLFLTLMGWLWYSNDAANKARERALAERSAIGALSTNTATTATLVQATNVPVIASTPLPDIVVQVPPTPTVHLLPEETNVLHSAEMDLMISSRGATLRAATLPAYRTRPEKNSGPVILDFDPQPALGQEQQDIGVPIIRDDHRVLLQQLRHELATHHVLVERVLF